MLSGLDVTAEMREHPELFRVSQPGLQLLPPVTFAEQHAAAINALLASVHLGHPRSTSPA